MRMNTMTQKKRTEPKYAAFGEFLTRQRQAAGLAQQADLSARIGTTQQTISRWEAGLSRPRPGRLPDLAAAVDADVNVLLQAAGYAPKTGPKTVVTSFDQPFPLAALPPDTFERFCADLIQALYPDAKIHRAGESGHDQDGIDIKAELSNGKVHTYQCKRVQEFGPQKVHTVVAADDMPADEKLLLLSRTASPQTRDAIRRHKGWDIWDKDDLSRKIRILSKAEQRRLVDVYFNRRRFELLGETEDGAWETPQDFFAPFENSAGLFNHVWKLVGRTQATSGLKKALSNSASRAVFLIGSGGAGKTRVLKQFIEAYEAEHPGKIVRFLSRTSELNKKTLEDFGSKPTLLVVDDAHDRQDLPLLFQFIASCQPHTKVLLALRPYGLERLKAQASEFGLVGSPTAIELPLPALSIQEAEELATQVLKKYKGPLQAAKDIARLTYDCPLATVVGAQIVAKEKMLFELAKNETSFRTTLFGRFQDVVAGEIGTNADAAPIKKLLKVLALLQPFHLDDARLLAAIQQIEGIKPHESGRLIKLLTNGGVLFKRGARYRLSPDVLADYIIEANCADVQGKSTGYAEIVFSAIGTEHLENFLVNLGKLDWLRSNGDATNSQLLDGIWTKLLPETTYNDPYIRAVTAVAFYQPAKALQFADRLIREGQYLDQLPELLRYVSYHMRYLKEACEALWEIGKSDNRELNRTPSHAIRVLSEMCEVRPNKPYEYNRDIVDFGLGLIGRPEAWKHRYSPLDIVSPILKTEAFTTTSTSRAMSFQPFFVNHQFVGDLREKVVNAILDLLSQPNTHVAVLAARRIGDALRYPMGMFGAQVKDATRNKWTPIFVETLEAVERAVKTGQLDHLVLYIIGREISWHADYGPTETSKVAKRIRTVFPKSLDFRVLCTLIDGYGTEFGRYDPVDHMAKHEKHLTTLVQELLKAYPDAEQLRQFIGSKLDLLDQNNPEKGNSAFIFCEKLLSASVEFARAVVEDACSEKASSAARFAAAALAYLWLSSAAEGRAAVRRFLASGREHLRTAVGQAYTSVFANGQAGDEEFANLRLILQSANANVVATGIAVIGRFASANPGTALEFAKLAKVGSSHNLADNLSSLFTWPDRVPFQRLTAADVSELLEKFIDVPELDGHWLETFLALASKAFPNETAYFFMRRVDRATSSGEWAYRPCNHGPYGHVPLRFNETAAYGPLLAKVVGWMQRANYQEEQQLVFSYRSRELFETMFGSFDGGVVQLLDNWSATADAKDMLLIGNILREASPDFVFNHTSFVERLLERAKRLDPDVYKRLLSGLLASAIGGIRQGIPGEPFPRDLEMKVNAETVLRSLSRFSAAYPLYDEINRHAEWNINRAHLDREAFEE
jgi:transcriptional regulator with XRE-family HTH domain